MGFKFVGRSRIEDLFPDRGIRTARKRIVQRTAEYTQTRAAHHSPVAQLPQGISRSDFIDSRAGRVPGTLKKSWRIGNMVLHRGGERITMEVWSIDPIAKYVEYPTQPHLIIPKDADGVLAFPVKGKVVFATIVHHPGTRGAFMLTTAIAEAQVEMQRIIREELAAWARGAYD